MTIGIYSLYWESPDLIYIGQSDCVERREKEHLRALRAGRHFNHKVQQAYDQYGNPEVILLDECSIQNLDASEIYWVTEFNAVIGGLNIAEPGSIHSSALSRNSKYSKRQILKVFALLLRGTVTSININKRTYVSVSIIKAIAAGTKHVWLSSEYPEKYATMRSINRSNNTKNNGRKASITYVLTSPDGKVNITNNLKEFCKTESSLSSNYTSAYSVLQRIATKSGRNKTYKGWNIYQTK